MDLGLILVALVFSILAFGAATWALVQVEAMKRSTHKVIAYNPFAGDTEENDFFVEPKSDPDEKAGTMPKLQNIM
jgi:hypothetical protein